MPTLHNPLAFAEEDGSWESRTFQTELEHLRAYQLQERELHQWLDGGNFEALEQWAAVYGIGTQACAAFVVNADMAQESCSKFSAIFDLLIAFRSLQI